MGLRTCCPFDPSSIQGCEIDRYGVWCFFAGPPTWVPWPCGPTTYDGADANQPLPMIAGDQKDWRPNGGTTRYLSLYPRELIQGELEIVHALPALQTGLATFGTNFLLPGVPVVLGGSLTRINFVGIKGNDPDVKLEFPVGTGNVRVTWN